MEPSLRLRRQNSPDWTGEGPLAGPFLIPKHSSYLLKPMKSYHWPGMPPPSARLEERPHMPGKELPVREEPLWKPNLGTL